VTATSNRCTDVQVAWGAVIGATSYNVLRGTTCGTVLNTFTGVTSPYNDTSAVAGTSYQYWVVAVNSCGNSANSSCAAGTRLVSPTPTITGASANVCPAVTVMLTTESGKSGYQWYNGGTPIGGATAYQYTVTATGSYTVSYTDTNGCSGTSAAKAVTITACAPNIVYLSNAGFTQVTGNGNAYYELGEKWSVQVTLQNAGNVTASNVTAQLTGNGISVCNNPGTFGTIGIGGSAAYTYQFVISPTFSPCGDPINFNIVSKTSTELTPAGADQNGVFSIANVGVPAAGSPTDLVIQPSSIDAYVRSGNGTNYGTDTTMDVRARATYRRGLVQFDLSGIPAGSTINSATLELYASTAGTSGNIDVHMITGTWTETGVSGTNEPAHNSTAEATIASGTGTGWKIWTVASCVQGWVNGTNTNYGFKVKAQTESGTTASSWVFATRENGTAGNRPILRVNYTPPSGGWTCTYVGTGTCAAAPNPKEASPSGTPMTSALGSGSSVGVTYTPACGATDHAIYWGSGPIAASLNWTNSACALGITGSATFDPGTPSPGGWTYFVIVGQSATKEGSYGQATAGERPPAVSVGACNKPQDLTGTCP
jgi:hypothetical protein